MGILVGLLLLVGVWHWALSTRRNERRAEIERAATALGQAVGLHFLTQSCSQCQECEMNLLEVSPSARSIHYQCRNCLKKMWASATSPAAAGAAQKWNYFNALLVEWNRRYPRMAGHVWFQTPEAPLPYETTAREPISKVVSSEVWRRDQGRCTACGCNQQLEFDHIIPVSRGGATSVLNLQLLCRGCNRRKAATI